MNLEDEERWPLEDGEDWLLKEIPDLFSVNEIHDQSIHDEEKLHVSEKDTDVRVANATAVEDMLKNEVIEREACCKRECNRRIPQDIALKHRLAFLKLSKEEKEIVIQSQLQMHRRIPELIEEYGENTKRGHCRVKNQGHLLRRSFNYYFCDLAVCKKMYFFLHDIGKKRFKNIAKHFDTYGLTLRTRPKLKFKKPKRDSVVLTEDNIHDIVNFIQDYADRRSISVGKTLPGCENPPPKVTKNAVYLKYCATDMKPVSRTTFMRVWNKNCPFITPMKSTSGQSEKVHEKKVTKHVREERKSKRLNF